MPDALLGDAEKQQLVGIVRKMESGGEKPDTIRSFVTEFHQRHAKPAGAPPAAPAQSFLDQQKQQLTAGFQGGVAHGANTVANAAKLVGATDTANSIRAWGQKQQAEAEAAPEPKGIVQEVSRDVGGLVPGVVEYAPAMFAKKGQSLIAAGIGALGAADKGLKAAAEQGLQSGLQFKVLEKAATAPTRAGRALASAAGSAGVSAVFGGNRQQIIAGGLLGGAGGALTHAREPLDRVTVPGVKEKVPVGQSLRKLFAPASVSAESRATMQDLRGSLGKLARDGKIVETALNGAMSYFDKLPVNPENPGGISDEALGFYHSIQTGDVKSIPEPLRPYAEVFRKAADERYTKLNERKLLQTYVENWAPQMWNRTEHAEEMYRVMGKRQLGGSGSFAKQRIFGNVKEGIEYAKANPDKGLRLVTNNPIEMMWLGLRDQDKTIQIHDFMQSQKNRGLLQYVKPEDKPPIGWSEVPTTVSRVLSGVTEKVPGGKYYMPKDSMDLINNLTGPGAHSSKLASMALYGGATLNKFSLGASLAHLQVTTIEAAISQAALAARYAALAIEKKSLSMAGKAAMQIPRVLSVPFDPLINLFRETETGRLAKQYQKPGYSPEMERFANLVSTAGGRVGQDAIYRAADVRAAQRGYYGLKQVARMAWKERDNIFSINPKYRADTITRLKQVAEITKMGTGLLQIPSAVIERMMMPIFEYAVPMQKLNAYQQMVKFEIDRLGPNATDDAMTKAVQGAWDSVDNRFGTFVYDNQGWSNWMKHSLMMSFRSVGWRWGTSREIGGGTAGWGKFLNDTANKQPREFTHSMAYMVAMPVVMGTLNAAMTYMLSGKWPQSAEDLFSFRTGEKDENGKEKRKQFLSYIQDVHHVMNMEGESYPGRLWNYARGAINPAIEVMAELASNKDFGGDQILDSQGRPIEKLEDLARYAVSQFVPLSMRQLKDPSQYKGKDRHPVLDFSANLVAIKDAPKDVQTPAYERYANEHMRTTQNTGRSRGESEKSQLRKDMLKAARFGEDAEFDRLFETARKKGFYREGDDRAIKSVAGIPPGVIKFRSLSLPDKLFAYQYALKDEKLDPREKDLLLNNLRASISKNLYKYTMREDDDREKIRVMNQLRILGMLDANGDFTN